MDLGMSSRDQAAHLKVYSKPEIVARYMRMDLLSACEQHLFDTHLRPGMAILDLGVGAGRTTPCLSAMASRYVGIDYSEEMVRACRSKFPQLPFTAADAADLSQFADASFDAVVFSYNGIDCLVPYEKRESCVRECHRVLKPGGIYIFSSHNPRGLFLDWRWDRDRLRRLASRVSQSGVLFHLALATLTCGRMTLGVARSLVKAVPRAPRLSTAAFWHGEGYMADPSDSGLKYYCGIPARVIADVSRLGFQLLEHLPENYPVKGYEYTTRWYYYAFSKL